MNQKTIAKKHKFTIKKIISSNRNTKTCRIKAICCYFIKAAKFNNTTIIVKHNQCAIMKKQKK